MKLLFCDNTIWGLVNFREPIFRYFYEQGHDIILVAPSDEKTELKTSLPDYVHFIPIQLDRTGYNIFADISYFFQLLKIYLSEKPDFIFHYTIKPNVYGSIVAAICRIPSVAMVAGLGYAVEREGIKGRIARTLYRIGLTFAKKVFVLNKDNYEKLIHYKIASEEQLIHLIGGEGLDTQKIQPISFASSNSYKTNFLMVGRVLYDKGYSEFVEAARLLKSQGINAEFSLLGPIDESYPNTVSSDTIKRDVEAGYINYLGFSRTPSKIMGKNGVVVVVPSYHEGMNRSIMEACALGRPVITTNIPGCREMVSDGVNGFLVPVKSGLSLAKAMEKYLVLPQSQQNEMGKQSRKIAVNKLDIKKVIERYEEVIKDF